MFMLPLPIRTRSSRGFTLIELLVVVVIIGILAAVAAPNLIGQTDKARTTEATAALSSISTGQEEYSFKHPGQYVTIGQPGETKVPAANAERMDAATDLANPATANTDSEQSDFRQILGIDMGSGPGKNWNFATAGNATVFNTEGDTLIPVAPDSGTAAAAKDFVAIAKGLTATSNTTDLGAQLIHSQNRVVQDFTRQQ